MTTHSPGPPDIVVVCIVGRVFVSPAVVEVGIGAVLYTTSPPIFTSSWPMSCEAATNLKTIVVIHTTLKIIFIPESCIYQSMKPLVLEITYQSKTMLAPKSSARWMDESCGDEWTKMFPVDRACAVRQPRTNHVTLPHTRSNRWRSLDPADYGFFC